jgi:hypothetical protein
MRASLKNLTYSKKLLPTVCWVILVVALSGFITACGRFQQNGTEDTANITVDMVMEPEQPAVGPARLVFTLTDQAGQAIDNAVLKVEGNMTHAGMVPVSGEAIPDGKGRYVVPFEWTMGGDWLLTIEITLADSTVVSREFPVTVSGARAQE